MPTEPHYSAADLARWGLLEAARREAARDQLIAAVPEPSAAELQVLLQQWAQQSQQQGNPAAEAQLARQWRWQRWCEQQGAARLASHFLARKTGLDQVRFWRLLCTDPELAAELYQQLREGETRFEQLAEQASSGGWQVEQAGPLPLERLSGELAALLRVSEVGVVWAPRPAAQGSWQIVLLEQSLQRAAPAHTRQELGDTLLAYIWDRLAAVGCVVQMPPAQAEQAGTDPVAQLEPWLPEHLGQPLELADLAAAVNLSPRRLQELCRQRHGCSPMDLLRQQRLALLAQQLHDPARAGTSLAALMAALQLSDSASTRQAFERAYGCSPAAYRRRGAMAAQPA